MIYVILFLILIFIIAPISLLFHEIGHVVGATMMRATSIRLTIGFGKPFWQTTFGHIQIVLQRFFLINSFTATVRDVPFTNKEKLWITFMGPFFSGLLTLITYIAYSTFIQTDLLYLFFMFNLWLMIINLIPFKIGQKQSDGYTICTQLIQHLKKR